MRRWITAVTGSSLFLLFPLAMGYLPYDHWDHLWPSVNVVCGLGLVCVMLGAALVLPRSTVSLTRQVLLGSAVVSWLATSLGTPVLSLDGPIGRALFSPHDTIAAAIAIAAALAAAIVACSRAWMGQFRAAFSSALSLQSRSLQSFIAEPTSRLTATFSPLRI